ncbi:hypothetical protein Hanom_Chr08g00757311 [Helianthus anomalus]
MSAKEKVKDIAPPKVEYQENALFKALTGHPSEISIILEGALALVGMSLCWRDVQIYPAFRTTDGAPFTLADLLYPERSSSILAADRPLRPGEDNIMWAHVSNFLISASHVDKVLQGLPINGDAEGTEVAAPAPKKTIRIRRVGGEISTKGHSSRAASPVATTTAAETVKIPDVSMVTTTAGAPVGLPLKKIRTVVPQLTNFEARRRDVLAGIGNLLNRSFVL